MPWIAAIVVGVLAILGLRSQRRRSGVPVRPCKPEKDKPRKQRVVLAIGSGGTQGIWLLEKGPSTMRAQSEGGEGTLQWLVDIETTDSRPHTIEIDNFQQGRVPRKKQDLFQDPKTLKAEIPAMAAGKTLKLHATLNSRLPQSVYTYTVFIDGEAAECKPEKASNQRAAADVGELYVCPVWPCGDFSE